MSEYVLPNKLPSAFRRLNRTYERRGAADLYRLLSSSRIHIEQGTVYDNWNGGIHGHDVVIYASEPSIDQIDIDDEERIALQICDELNKVTREVENEFVRAVYIKLADGSDTQYQSAIPFSREPLVSPEDVGLWQGEAFRLFLSHRDKYKSKAHELADALEPYGISTFVAHDSIKPMKEWQNEILNGMMTMEAMLVLLTDDFHEGSWTDQEIGYALGKELPIISVKVGSVDPRGFIGAKQALIGSLDSISNVAAGVCRALMHEDGQGSRLKRNLIDSFVTASCYLDAMDSLDRLTETVYHLNDAELNLIIEGYAQNDQLHGCAGIHNQGNRCKRFLEDVTGKKLEFSNNEITEVRRP